MPVQDFRDPRTADPKSSIWLDLPEDTFRQHVVELEECTNAVPIGPQVFTINQSDEAISNGSERLPLAVEQRLADDFAAIAAVEEGAQSVSAVCIEQSIVQPGITVRFAAVDTINESVQVVLVEVADILTRAASCTSLEYHTVLQNQLFTLFVTEHYRRILGRLRSVKWQKPTYLSRSHKKPLWQDLPNLIHRASFLYTKRESEARLQIEHQITTLSSTYESFETSPPETDISTLQSLILASYEFCTSPSMRTYASRLSPTTTSNEPTPQVASALKSLHQIEKLAAYIRIPTTLLELSRLHPLPLSKINLAYLKPYTSVPTTIGYEAWAKTTHVHAEVQLAVHYDLQSQSQSRSHSQPQLHAPPDDLDLDLDLDLDHVLPPRAIGTSKHLCYLCFLFLSHHARFHVSRTHGRLYDQWTIPDSAAYTTSTIQRYRSIIAEMDGEVVDLTRKVERELAVARGEGEWGEQGRRVGRGKVKAMGKKWRVEPMTSREDLLCLEDG